MAVAQEQAEMEGAGEQPRESRLAGDALVTPLSIAVTVKEFTTSPHNSFNRRIVEPTKRGNGGNEPQLAVDAQSIKHCRTIESLSRYASQYSSYRPLPSPTTRVLRFCLRLLYA
jgi:hypothetical protein